MTAQELAKQAREAKPHIRYAHHRGGHSVAAWTDGHWVPVAGKSICGDGWISLPFEILANGERLHKQSDWLEA